MLALTLWPNRSLGRRGSGWLLGLLAAGLAVPLVPLAGTKAAWGMLPFLLAALVGTLPRDPPQLAATGGSARSCGSGRT